MTVFDDMKNFMTRGGQSVNKNNQAQQQSYIKMILEETREFNEALLFEDRHQQMKEATDCLVVILGWMFSHGVDPQQIWDAVHKNNLLKVSEEVQYDANGKIQKSEASVKRKAYMLEQIKEALSCCDS